MTITHGPADPAMTAVCIRPGARLGITLTVEEGAWSPFKVIPQGAATVAFATDSADVVHATVSPAGTKSFCLSTADTSTMTPAVLYWLLCVTVRR